MKRRIWFRQSRSRKRPSLALTWAVAVTVFPSYSDDHTTIFHEVVYEAIFTKHRHIHGKCLSNRKPDSSSQAFRTPWLPFRSMRRKIARVHDGSLESPEVLQNLVPALFPRIHRRLNQLEGRLTHLLSSIGPGSGIGNGARPSSVGGLPQNHSISTCTWAEFMDVNLLLIRHWTGHGSRL